MKKVLFLLTTFFFSLQSYSAIKPSSKPSAINDLYFNYQWALENSGQVVIGDIDDITPYETKGESWANIDWSIELDSMMVRDTVVAVIDSGVDLEHEDLKGRILLNPSECRDGRVPLGPTGDPDKNGFEGDCAGWNFATKDVRRQRLADDDVGHGTHVAGIIAANVNNGVGLAGLSNRIKILPLKVYDTREGQMPAGTQEVISVRVARAINYAVDRKVDVINLSLGWPILASVAEVKTALQRAEDHGILVVAAAGNDRHEAQIYPCAFKSVFCVGSINVDGEMSRFSNFGGQVDILAPGGQILGLIPMTLSSDFFGMKGYDIKFGTSQAAPYVAGAAAIMKGIYPDASNEEIRSALMSSARNVSPKAGGLSVFSSSGLMQVKKAIKLLQEKKSSFPRPVFKEFDRVSLDESSLSAQILLPIIQNEKLGPKDIRVEALTDGVDISWNWQHEGIFIKIAAQNEWVDAILKFKVTILGKTFSHQILLTKQIQNKKKTFLTSQKGLLQKLQTVPVPSQGDVAPRFFYFSKEEKSLYVYELEDGEVKLKINIKLAEIDFLLDGIGLQRVDIDQDGILDYWVSGIVADDAGKAKELRYLFFDDEGRFINQELHQNSKQTLKLVSDFSLPIPAQSRFIKLSHPEWGEFHSALFLSFGPAELIDQSTDDFDPNRELRGVHLNYLMPEREGSEVIWRVRTLTNASFLKQLRSQLNLPSWANFELLTLRLAEESSSNEVSVFLRTGSGIVQDYFHLNLEARDVLAFALNKKPILKKPLKLTSFKTRYDFSNQVFDAAFIISEEGELTRQTILKGQFAKDRMRSILLGDNQTESIFSYKTQDPKEFVASLIKEYHWRDKSVRFFELDTTLEVISVIDNQTKIFSAPLYRTSFVQGSTFSLRFNPMLARDVKGELVPSLYVDNTALFSPTFYMWIVDQEKVYVPVKHSFEVPSHCLAMNPLLYRKRSHAVLFCKGQNGPESIDLVAF